MAKRGRPARATSLDGLVSQLSALDQQRKNVIDQIRQATNRLLSGENPFPWRRQGRPAASAGSASASGQPAGRKRKRRKMSKEAREKIAAAQRARWARQKKAKAS